MYISSSLRYYYDHFEGSCEAVSNARQLEVERNFCNWSCSWHLYGIDDSPVLLGHA